jgi:hypothetical protein
MRDVWSIVCFALVQVGVLVVQSALTKWSKHRRNPSGFIGLGSTLVEGFSSANINVQAADLFRLESIIIPPDIAKDFLITDIKIGRNSQFISERAIPAGAFTKKVGRIRLRMDVAVVSQFITVSVKNQNGDGRNFQGVLLGTRVRPLDSVQYG